MNKKFYEKFKEKKFLIAAHRGTFGGNVIDNTYFSSKIAIELGADIVEIDSILSTDGVLYAFHDNEEKRKLGIGANIKTLSSVEIDKLEYYNVLGEKSGQKVTKLEELLKKLKGKSFINLDRSWGHFEEIFKLVEKLEMEEQVIIKSPPIDEVYNFLRKNPKKLMYMVIARKKEEVYKFLNSDINLVAAELIFTDKNQEIVSKEFLEELKEKNIKIWINSITLGAEEKHNLSGNYDDNNSFEDNSGWKELVKIGADIIQTDWPSLLKQFRDK